jgi:hypothetical protein
VSTSHRGFAIFASNRELACGKAKIQRQTVIIRGCPILEYLVPDQPPSLPILLFRHESAAGGSPCKCKWPWPTRLEVKGKMDYKRIIGDGVEQNQVGNKTLPPRQWGKKERS